MHRARWFVPFAAVLAGSCADGSTNQKPDEGTPDQRRALWPMPSSALSGLPNRQSYDVDASPELVIDRVTGLAWQRTADMGPGEAGGFVGDDSLTHCADLVLAGHDDFRLPTRIELVSIVDDWALGPALDTVAFPGASSEAFWSGSSVPNDPEQRFHVNFYFGYTTANLTVYAQSVRCVRTERHPERSALAPLVVGADLVRDPATGLSWQRAPPREMAAFADALARCEGLELEGVSDFRLPSVKELQTLVREDMTSGPLIDQEAFPESPADVAWSSSALAGDPESAWMVRFSDGYSLYTATSTPGFVRCVR